MPRVCTVEERLLTSRHESLQKTKTFETGLLVGSVGSKADALLHFVPTPEQEGSKASAVDADWMAEHAAQVARMLSGGGEQQNVGISHKLRFEVGRTLTPNVSEGPTHGRLGP